MSVYRTNSNQAPGIRCDQINDMVLEIQGMIAKAGFDKNELDQLFAMINQPRKFVRNDSLGHTLTTYTGWTHLKSEDGYSIWKYTPTSYVYNALNEVYVDDEKLQNKGLALTESASAFDTVFNFNGDSGSGYTDDTTEAGTEIGTEFSLMNSVNDYLYVGLSATYAGIKFEFHTRGANYNLVVEYWNGSAWTALVATTNLLDDDTHNFGSDGAISWTIPTNWATTTVNSVASKYWIRISTTTTPVTTAKAYYVIPANSVPALLSRSGTQVLNQDWAWCTYGTSIYVTIRNAGAASAEGNFFITSSSSTNNKQNFFIYNHEYSANHEKSGFDAVTTIATTTYSMDSDDGVMLVNAASNNVTITLPTAYGIEGKEYVIKCIGLSSGFTCVVEGVSAEMIDGAANYSFSSANQFIGVVSDGSGWRIVRRH